MAGDGALRARAVVKKRVLMASFGLSLAVFTILAVPGLLLSFPLLMALDDEIEERAEAGVIRWSVLGSVGFVAWVAIALTVRSLR